MEIIPEKIIDKIRKLLNLGKRGGSEEEASLAMSKAQELLTRYNLSEAAIGDGEKASTEEEKRQQTNINHSAMYEWQRSLCGAIARANYCFHYVIKTVDTSKGKPRFVKRHQLIGREANVVAVQFMYEYLIRTLEEILPYPNSERLSRSATSWKLGAVDRLIARIERKAWEMANPKEEGKQQFGLMVRDLSKREYEGNFDFIFGEGAYARARARMNTPAPTAKELTEEEKAKQEANWKKYCERQRKQEEQKLAKMDMSAFRAGQEAGDKISLQDRIL